jgi:pimeloyl-ACP methyl ester carboxylesterase
MSSNEFHVVIPSLPGFGFSTPLSGTGWELARTTDAFAEIMTRLGYERFAAHGTDIGSGTTGRLAALYPERVIGTHIGADRRLLGLIGDKSPYPDGLSDDETAQIEAARTEDVPERGHLAMQDHRPDTIGAALTDSPVGQLAWIAEKFMTKAAGDNRTPDESVDRDQLLTNISLYWFTRSGESSAHSGLDLLIHPACPPDGPYSTPTRSCAARWARGRRSATGASSPRAATSSQWRRHSCSQTTSALPPRHFLTPVRAGPRRPLPGPAGAGASRTSAVRPHAPRTCLSPRHVPGDTILTGTLPRACGAED